MGKPANFIQKIERGQRRVSAEDLIDIGKALGIAPERLLKHILI